MDEERPRRMKEWNCALAGVPACAREKKEPAQGRLRKPLGRGRTQARAKRSHKLRYPAWPTLRGQVKRDRASPERGHDDAAGSERGAISGDVSLSPRAISEGAGGFLFLPRRCRRFIRLASDGQLFEGSLRKRGS